jgi:hypothetical protein
MIMTGSHKASTIRSSAHDDEMMALARKLRRTKRRLLLAYVNQPYQPVVERHSWPLLSSQGTHSSSSFSSSSLQDEEIDLAIAPADRFSFQGTFSTESLGQLSFCIQPEEKDPEELNKSCIPTFKQNLEMESQGLKGMPRTNIQIAKTA